MNEPETKLQKYFLNLLARRDYSEAELRSKALTKDYTPELVEQIIQWLIAKNYLNETRLAKNLVETYGQTKGRKWLTQKLQSRQVKREVVEEILNHFQETVPQSLKTKVEQKYHLNNWNNLEPQIKQKILGYLARQGYNNPYEILRTWTEDV